MFVAFFFSHLQLPKGIGAPTNFGLRISYSYTCMHIVTLNHTTKFSLCAGFFSIRQFNKKVVGINIKNFVFPICLGPDPPMLYLVKSIHNLRYIIEYSLIIHKHFFIVCSVNMLLKF